MNHEVEPGVTSPSRRVFGGLEAPPIVTAVSGSASPPDPGAGPVHRGLSIASKSFCIMKQGLQTAPRNNRKAYAPFNATVPHTISDHGSRRPLRADAGMGSLEGVV